MAAEGKLLNGGMGYDMVGPAEELDGSGMGFSMGGDAPSKDGGMSYSMVVKFDLDEVTMGDETKMLLWQNAKEGDVEALKRVISSCEKERISINSGNPERFGATAIHYGKSAFVYPQRSASPVH